MFKSNSSQLESDDADMQAEQESPYRIRVMTEGDLARIVDIDSKAFGHVRQTYFEEK